MVGVIGGSIWAIVGYVIPSLLRYLQDPQFATSIIYLGLYVLMGAVIGGLFAAGVAASFYLLRRLSDILKFRRWAQYTSGVISTLALSGAAAAFVFGGLTRSEAVTFASTSWILATTGSCALTAIVNRKGF
ncbi:hypothetical protein BH09ACT1_BH09ACT1_04430 [soil metagenome]